MKNTTKILFATMLMMSTMMIISSTNWLSMWMGLEINMMSFIVLMSKNKNNLSSESMMTYFLIQSVSSIVFLMTIMMSPLSFIANSMMSETTNTVMMSSMLMKMGASPFHFWLTEIMEKMEWMNCLILMTWQKIAPLFILSTFVMNNMIIVSSLLSVMVGSIGGLNQTSVRKIMAYSSINHLGWMLVTMKFESELWMMYLVIYSVIVITAVIFFSKNSTFYINQMTLGSSSMMEKMSFATMMMSMGGLPPFLGFLPKWMVIQSMVEKNMYMIIVMMMAMTLMTLFYYIRMISTLILINSTSTKWMMKKKKNTTTQTLILMTNTMLPMVITINLF